MARSVRSRSRAWALLLLLGLCPVRAISAPVVPDGFADTVVLDGLSLPVGMAFLPDGRLLVIEQKTAQVRLAIDPSSGVANPIGTIPNVNVSGTERGLLGIAVDPQWPTRPYIYTHSTNADGHIHISRFTLTGDLTNHAGGALALNPGSEYVVVGNGPDAADIHNGGTVRFGPDHMLYATIGEDNAKCLAQDSTSLHGVVMRLDVSQLPAGTGTAPRALVVPADNPFAAAADSNLRIVWAFGLRNPFRLQLDPVTGVAYISDVGESTWEELDRAESGGLDFGWPLREGPADFSSGCTGGPPTTLTDPIFSYNHSVTGGSAVIITAGAYRPPATGTAFPTSYWGDVFAEDFYAGMLWRLHDTGNGWVVADPVPGQSNAQYWGTGYDVVSDWAVGPDGALWYCKLASSTAFTPNTGQIRRITTLEPAMVPGVPARVALAPAYPLPSRGTVHLDFTLSRPAVVELSIHDLAGGRVRRLFHGSQNGSGPVAATWDGRDDAGHTVRAGLYFARLTVDGVTHSRRVVIAR